MQADDPPLRVDDDLRVPALAVGVLLGEADADVDALLDGLLLQGLDLGAVELQPGHVLAEVVAVERQLGEADELGALGRELVDEVEVAFQVGLDVGLVGLGVGAVGVEGLDVDQGHVEMAGVLLVRLRGSLREQQGTQANN